MPELRTDWLTARTVLIAENRANRPNEFDAHGEAASAAARTDPHISCPFCPGNESNTPPAHYEEHDDQNRWCLRIIPNKFPAVIDFVAIDGAPVAAASTSAGEPPAATSQPAFGVHEVIVETARHVDRTSSLSEIELRRVLEAYAARLRHWSSDERLAYGLVFKNQGQRAGASLAHLHSQLIAMPAVPTAVAAEMRRANESHAEHRTCAYCRLIQQERETSFRFVSDRDGYFAFCPFVSLHPCEVWLMPQRHEPSFERVMTDDAMERLARMLRAVIVGLESLVPSASFNMLLRTASWTGDNSACFHWRIELQPRMNAIAGLESATGIYVNPVAPERAAERLRDLVARTLVRA